MGQCLHCEAVDAGLLSYYRELHREQGYSAAGAPSARQHHIWTNRKIGMLGVLLDGVRESADAGGAGAVGRGTDAPQRGTRGSGACNCGPAA